MTTKITVDAHAGRQIEVTHLDTNIVEETIALIEIVEPGEIRYFHVWEGREIRLREINPNAKKELI